MPRKARRKRRGRGEGSIYQRADGYWIAAVSDGVGPDGKRRRRVVSGKTKADVLRQLAALPRQAPPDATRATVGEYLTSWLGTLSDVLAHKYGCVVRVHILPTLGPVKLADLTPLRLRQFFAGLDASPSAPFQAGVVLGSALKAAVRLDVLAANPLNNVDRPKRQKSEMKTWTREQVQAFLRAAERSRIRGLWVTAVGTGMRQGELFGLHWPDVSFEGSFLTVRRQVRELRSKLIPVEPKTPGSRRRIDLPRFVVDALHQHRKAMLAEGRDVKAGPVFCSLTGGYLCESSVKRQFHILIRRAELPRIRFHDLRHTAATLLLEAGENPKVVAERLGHASVATTLNIYGHVTPTMQRGAAEKLDRLLG